MTDPTTRWHYWVFFVDSYNTPKPVEFICKTWEEFYTQLQRHIVNYGPVEHLIRLP